MPSEHSTAYARVVSCADQVVGHMRVLLHSVQGKKIGIIKEKFAKTVEFAEGKIKSCMGIFVEEMSAVTDTLLQSLQNDPLSKVSSAKDFRIPYTVLVFLLYRLCHT